MAIRASNWCRQHSGASPSEGNSAERYLSVQTSQMAAGDAAFRVSTEA